MLSVGVDPSLVRTALAAVDDGEPVTWHVLPTKPTTGLHRRLRLLAGRTAALITPYAPDIIVVEEPGYMAKVGGKAQAAVHRAIGAVLAALPPEVPVHVVAVGVIRRHFGLGKPGTKRDVVKAQVVAYLEERGIEVPKGRGGRPDDDVADAYLAALYGLEA